MRHNFGSQLVSLRRSVRAILVGPHLAAFLPAILLGAYWFGGEGVLLTVAVIFPAIMAFGGIVTRPKDVPLRRDAVTGLSTRQHLISRLDTGLAICAGDTFNAPICFAIEIDDMRHLDDLYGPQGAETILKATADRLRATLRDGDDIAALGPGRFAIALAKTPRSDLESMIQLSGRLQAALSAPIQIDSVRVLITASVGFALPARVPDQTGEAYLGAAESALAEAYSAGPGSIRAFSKGMRPRIELPENIDEDVAAALESGQIRPWFQPQISTDTGALTGFEALARWQHPDKGMIAPASFLPAIGKAGLIERLGEVMLFHALTALRDWDRAGLDVPSVAVNLSAEELQNPKLHEKIRWELDRFEMTPDRLTVEILEDVIERSDDDISSRNIAALSRLGCGIDLDDFGTGHASFANIRRFDVKRIKIDRSYITHVDTDSDQQNYVGVMLTMAERLGLEVVGEGVESHGEHAMLAQLGCQHVQGYSIGRPMPAEQAASWIRDQNKKSADIPRISQSAL